MFRTASLSSHQNGRLIMRISRLLLLAIALSMAVVSSIPSEKQETTVKTTKATHSLLESVWKTFKQTLESTISASDSDSSNQKENQAHHPHRGESSASSRRIQLMEQTLQEHYTRQLIESSPHLDHYYHNADSSESSGSNSEDQDQGHAKKVTNSNQKPFRWRRSDLGSKGCHFFSESMGASWSFQWCPQEAVYQGHRKDDLSLHNKHNLGRFVPWTIGKDINDDLASGFATGVRLKYPKTTVELYHDGDFCEGSRRLRTTRRVSVVVIHAADSRYCSEVRSQDPTHSIIESVEEPNMCTYIIHVCNAPTPKKTQEGQDFKTGPITESDAKEINQTMQRIHEVMHTYLHQTQADAYQKSNPDRTTSLHVGLPPLPPSRIQANLKLIKDMFMHAYDSYMYHAYPASEVKPMTCQPAVFNLVKIPALTLIDSLDTLVLLGNFTEFARSVERLRALDKQMAEESAMLANGGLFALNQNVSVFETNIRVLGGLLSAHQLAEAFLQSKVLETHVWAEDKSVLFGETPEFVCKQEDITKVKTVSEDCSKSSLLDCQEAKSEEQTCQNQTAKYWSYDGFLLELAHDIGDRLLPAFQTRTGIPYGTVNLLSGIPEGETTIASLAGGGTLSLEMELLSRLTGNPEYGRAAKLSARALWMRRSQFNLFGKHICTRRGEWTESLSGIGSNSDSYYEYLIKHYILFPEDQDFWFQMVSAYGGVHNESRLGEWYGDVDLLRGLSTGGGARKVFESLMAFYPGMQVLLGELTPAARSLNSFFLVREFLGFLPERFNFGSWKVESSGGNHLLRPELLESAYFLHRASKGFQQQFRPQSNSTSVDSSGWQWAADFALHTLEKLARTDCGYASLRDLSPTTTGALGSTGNKKQMKTMNEMPSYFLSETLKYLYLTFDEDNLLHTDEDRDWVFTTEAHPIHHPNPLNQKDKTTKLEDQKQQLIDRLRSRVQGVEAMSSSAWNVLDHEKWTEGSQLLSFMQQIEPVVSQIGKANALRTHPVSNAEHVAEFLQTSRMVEPFLAPEQVYLDFDFFNETQNKMNAAHLTFRKMGNEVSLTRACPNFYMSDFLWIRALNGGGADYADAYRSSAEDAVSASESRFYMLGSVDALALHGSGVHAVQLFDESRYCSVKEQQKHGEKPNSSSQSSTNAEQKGKDRFNMGGDLGDFDVSAFPGGSGFYIQHVESSETLITTLIEDETNAPEVETYVMVYSNRPVYQPKIETNSRLETLLKTEVKESEVAGARERSVVMADLKGNAYICQIEIVVSKTLFMQHDTEKDYADTESTSTETEKVLAKYPCAPALFGPTHMSELVVSGGIVVEASIRTPKIGEEHGCESKKQDSMPMVVQEEGGVSPNSLPHASAAQYAAVDDDPIQDDSDQTCQNKVVQLLQRGICTFQEKSTNQKKSGSADAVIMINSEEDELFVMSGGGMDDPEYLNNQNYPPTVLVTGSDGRGILQVVDSFEHDDASQLFARVSLVRDEIEIVEAGSAFTVTGNKHWPAIRASSEALQVFARGGWGVHAVQRSGDKAKNAALEWQLYLMRYEI